MTSISPEQLAALCFRKVPADVVDRDVVLAALWHLHRRSAEQGLPVGGPFKAGHLGKESGLRAKDYRTALDLLVREHLVVRAARSLVSLTMAGYSAARDIVDVDHVIAMQNAA